MCFSDRIRDWKILLVDDEPDNLGVAQQILQFYGADVYTACDGQEALDLLKDMRPTFIISDLSMPNMDGWELLQKLHGNPEWSNIPVIALTAHAMPGDKEKALDAGFHQYISKPFRIHSFLQDLEDCMTRLEARNDFMKLVQRTNEQELARTGS